MRANSATKRDTSTATLEPPSLTLTVTVGPRNAYTDPDSGLRFYRWQGHDLPSVTSIRRLAGLPHGLHQWSINQVVAWALDNAPAIADRLRDPAQFAVVRHELKGAATAERDRAAALGTAVHDAAAAGRALADVPAEVAPRLRQFYDWLETSKAEVLGREFQVFNLTLGYAGSCDLLVRFPNGTVWVVDLKTGKGIYSDHALQLMAYAKAEFVGSDNEVDTELTAVLRDVSGIAVLHLADDSWGFYAIRFDDETWRAFRGLLAFSIWAHMHSNVESFVTGFRNAATQ